MDKLYMKPTQRCETSSPLSRPLNKTWAGMTRLSSPRFEKKLSSANLNKSTMPTSTAGRQLHRGKAAGDGRPLDNEMSKVLPPHVIARV
jgi:hypothetical protein